MTHQPRTHASLALLIGALIVLAPSAGAIACPHWDCGGNAAELNELPIGELHLVPGQNTGEVSAWDARVVGFTAPPDAPDGPGGYILQARGGRFVAVKDGFTLAGSELLGSELLIENTTDGTTETLIIHDHGTVLSWTEAPFPVDRYVLTSYDEVLQRYVPVCADATDVSDDSAWAVLVSGERYSWSGKTVLATGQEGAGWFNISCKDNALYKMKVMGYDPEPPEVNPHVTTPEQRQATLKMLTADYCGTGYSFTENGTPLHWFNQAGWSDNGVPPASTYEAHWDHTGALCLDTPRLGLSEMEAIQDECASVNRPLPPCSEFAGAYEWGTEKPE